MKLFRTRLILAVAFVPYLATSACTIPTQTNHNDLPNNKLPQASTYFVHGDPEELIAGSVQDNQGLGAFDDPELFKNFTLIGFVQFSEKVARDSVQQIANQSELEQQNSTNASANQALRRISDYAFIKDGDALLYKDQETSHQDYPVLRFENKNGLLALTHIDDKAVEPVHYSVKDNGQAMSILVRTHEATGTTLTAMYFNRIKALRKMTRELNVPENYFLEGDGKAITWKQDISIDVCGKDRAKYQADVAEAVAAWSEAGAFNKGYIGKYRYRVAVKDDARPFTDLNQNCVNFIERYKNEDQENFVNMGVTLPMVDEFNQEIFNAQIFIFLNATARSDMAMISVLTHEMGHLLGLGHEFKSSPDDQVFASIMGYLGEPKITASDRKAISYLYAD